jgi:uncharacterized RDD family membrane protein YckC
MYIRYAPEAQVTHWGELAAFDRLRSVRRPNLDAMSSTPPGGYQPGDYIPFKDRDPANPTAVVGQPGWGEQVAAQSVAGPHDPYRAIYGYDAPQRVPLAGWGRRVLAYAFDSFLAIVLGSPFFVGYWQLLRSLETTTNAAGEPVLVSGTDVPSSALGLMAVGGLLYLGFYVYNWCIRQGRTGYTFGKTVVGIKLVGERSGQPIGGLLSFVRQLAHILDGLVCNLGYLWPLWDPKNQTFADKIMGTLVIVQPQDQPQDPAQDPAQGMPAG